MSKSDEELVRNMFYRQANEKVYSYFDLRGYSDWANRKIAEGEGPEILAHMEAFTLHMLPEEAAATGEAFFEEALADTKSDLGLE